MREVPRSIADEKAFRLQARPIRFVSLRVVDDLNQRTGKLLVNSIGKVTIW
jgi:hypothetical protein